MNKKPNYENKKLNRGEQQTSIENFKFGKVEIFVYLGFQVIAYNYIKQEN